MFVLESLVFILIGLSLREVAEGASQLKDGIGQLLRGAALIVGVVVASRMLWIVATTYLVRALAPGIRRRDPFPRIGIPVVMAWAGTRGVVSLAAALALPVGFPGRDVLLVVTFAVIIATVLVQAPTL